MRTVLIFLPEYMEPEQITAGDICQLAYIRAEPYYFAKDEECKEKDPWNYREFITSLGYYF